MFQRVKDMPISFKLILIYISSVIILLAGIGWFMRGYIEVEMKRELVRSGSNAAQSLAANCVKYILLDDLVACQHLVERAKALEEDISYAFILNHQGLPLVHSFEKGVPRDLVALEKTLAADEEVITMLKTEQGLIRNIRIPILKGKVGSLHVGISEARITAVLNRTIRWGMVFAITVTLIGTVAIVLVTRIVLAPLVELAEGIREISSGRFGREVRTEARDEIGALVVTFNEMTRKLEEANQELEETQSQLIQSAKLATVGQFAAGIAHEVNNPLAGILNCVRTLLEEPETGGKAREYLDLALKGLLRIDDTISRLLSFSGRHEIKHDRVDINGLVDESVTFSQHRIAEKDLSLDLDLSPELSVISGDPNQLQHVFMNIAGNALDALDAGGNLTIRSRAVNGAVQVEFKDDGEGIASQDLRNIFDPFFTTKEVGKGVGLGLYISYRIIQQHGGTIEVSSEKGHGTTMTVVLPLPESA